MKNVLKNIILVVALSAVLVIVMMILLYDFIPNGVTVATPNTYTADSKTTKVLSEIAETSASLSGSTNSSSTSSTKSNIVLKSYAISETDLALYSAAGLVDTGKANPFEDYQASSGNGNGSSSSGETSGGSSNSGTAGSTSSTGSGNTSDGTLFNSKANK